VLFRSPQNPKTPKFNKNLNIAILLKWRKIRVNRSKKIKMVKFIQKAHNKKMYMKIFTDLYCKITII
jgi:hypothetical protein